MTAFTKAEIEAALDAFYDGREWDDNGTSSINRRAEMSAALTAGASKRVERLEKLTEALLDARCPVDSRNLVRHCTQCGCSIGAYRAALAGKK